MKTIAEVIAKHLFMAPMEIFGHGMSPLCSCGKQSKYNMPSWALPVGAHANEFAEHVAQAIREEAGDDQ